MKWWPSKKRSQVRRLEAAYAMLKARFDAAQSTADNRKHWLNADNLSADAAYSNSVRSTLRNRSRYEVGNNTYAKGIIQTLANDCVGTGPRLQLLTENEDLNRRVERDFAQWGLAVDLAPKLRTMRQAKATDGEVFGMLTNNPGLDLPVTLDVEPLEADYVTQPLTDITDNPRNVDGVLLDEYGNPHSYNVLKNHPGDWYTGLDESRIVSAKHMIHWFRADRPGQHRGIPEITSALPLFAQLRRYTLAVISAAETAAALAVVMKTSLLPEEDAAAIVEPLTEMDIVRNMMVFAPEGWEPEQLRAEQPTTTYAEFKHEILNEIARCLNMPFNIAACNSSEYNYASGRLDHQTYFKSIRVERSQLTTSVLDPIFNAWVYEAMLHTEYAELRHMQSVPHQWFFDGTEHVDPAKEAAAQKIRLANKTTNLAAEYAKEGKDWETELRQSIKEKLVAEKVESELRKELGLPATEAPKNETPAKQAKEEQNV